jgi:hypothetical protein
VDRRKIGPLGVKLEKKTVYDTLTLSSKAYFQPKKSNYLQQFIKKYKNIRNNAVFSVFPWNFVPFQDVDHI